jgi:transcriptional regulator GlxA family with amidase domain
VRRVAILTFDGFNEIDSFVVLHVLNRLAPDGWRAELVGPSPKVTSMNGVTSNTQSSLDTAKDADVVLFGSGAGGRQVARDPKLRGQIDLNPNSQLIGAQCSGTLLMASLGLLDGLPACTDDVTRPWVKEVGIDVLDQPFVAYGHKATAGGCLSSVYLATWVITSMMGVQTAERVLRSVAPVGEADDLVHHALGVVHPYVTATSCQGLLRPSVRADMDGP